MIDNRQTASNATLGADLASAMQRSIDAAAAAAVRAGQDHLAVAWRDAGLLAETSDTVVLTGADLRRQRTGTRTRLADARLLWPEG